MNKRRLLERVRNNPRDVRFSDLLVLVGTFGDGLRGTKGSHRVYVHPGVPERLNLQPDKHGKAREYQVKQCLDAVATHDLRLEDEP